MDRSDNYNRPTWYPIEEGCRRIRMKLMYDGYTFHGWQRQKDVRTVQEVLEKVIEEVTGTHAPVHASGRTDTGVHALGQVVHFDTPNLSIPPASFTAALNARLPRDVRISESIQADERFHARFTSLAREYRYVIKELNSVTPFDAHRVCRIHSYPSLVLLNSYAEILLGTHDFSTFGAAQDQSISKIRDMFESRFVFDHFFSSEKVLIYIVKANAFMMHQVRSMVGTMLQLAAKSAPPEEMRKLLEERERRNVLRTAPSEGLYLYDVEYADEQS